MIKVFRTVKEINSYSSENKKQGKKIGFVPTMGYLHDGHLSLLKESKNKCDISVVSIFVNPTQFSPNEDLSRYPRDFERDENLLIENGADAIFYPDVEEIYPEGYETFINVEELSQKHEGEFRPTHFKGVATVVAILFNSVMPDYAFFGRKDAQQAALIQKMVFDLKMNVEIVVCPIIREPDGLAMSSRNVYLSTGERKDALVLKSSLELAVDLIRKGETESKFILEEMKNLINGVKTSTLDYVKIIDASSFNEIKKIEKGKKIYILVACKIGKTRLIDNELIEI